MRYMRKLKSGWLQAGDKCKGIGCTRLEVIEGLCLECYAMNADTLTHLTLKDKQCK